MYKAKPKDSSIYSTKVDSRESAQCSSRLKSNLGPKDSSTSRFNFQSTDSTNYKANVPMDPKADQPTKGVQYQNFDAKKSDIQMFNPHHSCTLDQ